MAQSGQLSLLYVPSDTCSDLLMGQVGPGACPLLRLVGYLIADKPLIGPQRSCVMEVSHLDFGCRNGKNIWNAFRKRRDKLTICLVAID